MFSMRLAHADHVRHYSIAAAASGWEVRCEEDNTLRRLDHYDDWHRVERALQTFQLEVNRLFENGWRVAS